VVGRAADQLTSRAGAHQAGRQDIVLTASTAELQKFILRHANDKDAFGGTSELKKRKPPVAELRLGRLIRDEAIRLSRVTGDSATRSAPTLQQWMRCESTGRGAIVGGLIGAAAGVALAILGNRRLNLGGGYGPVQTRHVVGFGAGGAGLGAIVGFAVCDK
jgi:hypothetical protein